MMAGEHIDDKQHGQWNAKQPEQKVASHLAFSKVLGHSFPSLSTTGLNNSDECFGHSPELMHAPLLMGWASR